MHDTATRVRPLKTRMRQCRLRREKLIYRLSALCFILFSGLMYAFNSASGFVGAAVYGMSSAMFPRTNAGSYVLVGILSFAVAVIITVACIRLKEKTNKGGK